MNILLINNLGLPLPPVLGGAVEHLINFFLEDNEINHMHHYDIISSYNEDAEMKSKEYVKSNFYYIRLGKFNKIKRATRHIINKIPFVNIPNYYSSKVLKYIRKNKKNYDYIIVENSPQLVPFINKLYPNKVILHLHNDWLNVKTKNAKKILLACKEVWTISNSLKSWVDEIAPTNKVKVLYNGVDFDKFGNSSSTRISELKNKYNIKEEDFVITYSGRLVPEKGVKEIIMAFNKSSLPSAKLMIIGGATYSNNAETQYVSSLYDVAKDNPNIMFTGYVPYDEMPAFYALTKLGVMPSLCNDAFNMTIIECMISGAPVIVSNKGALPEILDSLAGKVIDSNNSIEEMSCWFEHFYNNINELFAMSQNAKNRAKFFSKTNYLNRYKELLNNLNNGK